MLSSASSPSAIAIGRSGHSPCGERRSSSAAMRSARRTRISRTLGMLVYAQTLVQVFAWLLGERISNTSTGSERVACPGAKGAQVIADQGAKFILQEAMNRARRRHRARLAIDELISEVVLRIPFEELRDGHPDRNFRRCQHGRCYSMDRPRDTFRGASIREKAPRG